MKVYRYFFENHQKKSIVCRGNYPYTRVVKTDQVENVTYVNRFRDKVSFHKKFNFYGTVGDF